LEDTLDVSVESGVLTSEVFIGSFASGIAVAETPSGGERVYLSVRSDADLTFVDVNDAGGMNCGADGGFESSLVGDPRRHRCANANRESDQSLAEAQDITLPSDPVALATGPLEELGGPAGFGQYVVTAHRGGRMSLFVVEANGGLLGTPFLVNVLEGLPRELVTVSLEPSFDGLPRRLWVPNALAPEISRVGVALDASPRDVTRSYLYDAGAAFLAGVDTGGAGVGDTRALRFDPREGVRRAYVLSRRPRALLSVDLSEDNAILEVRDIMEVGIGPSRLEVRRFEDSDRTLAFVSCFDTRDVYVLDVDQGRLVGIVRGLGGAFELAFSEASDNPDEDANLLYVVDFQASIVRVLDLEPMFECLDNVSEFDPDRECSPEPLGFLGRPNTRRELI
ncbi:MAG: hypothetical protein AAF411_20655, partial [Myxococcota bacterium]